MRTVAVIGCGKPQEGKVGFAAGHAHAKSWVNCGHEIQLIGVDPNEENLEAFGKKFGLDSSFLYPSTEALYQTLTPDYVAITTWPILHAAQTIEAAEHGVKGIVCEKPMGCSPGEMKAMMEATQKQGAELVICHQRRHNFQAQKAKSLLKSGVLGDGFLSLQGQVLEDWDILSYTCHWMDLANFVFDEMPQTVMAGGDYTAERRYGHPVENAISMIVEYPNNKIAHFLTGPDTGLHGLSIQGEKGVMRLFTDKGLELFTKDGYEHFEPPIDDTLSDHAKMAASLIEAVESGNKAPLYCGVALTAVATEMCFAAHESMRTQRKVTLPISFEYPPLSILENPSKQQLPIKKSVLLADNHHGPESRKALHSTLESITGHEVTNIMAKDGLRKEDLADATCLFLYHTHSDIDSETQTLLTDWIESGKPTVMLHCAIGAYRNWEAFKNYLGRYWVWDGLEKSGHPHVPSTIEVINDSEIQFPWSTAWLPQDEVYVRLAEAGECIDCAEAQFDEQTEPLAWIVKKHPNVVVWLPGHRADVIQLPVYREALQAVIKKVTG